MTPTVIASPAARRAITRLRASHGPVSFVQSAGCRGGTAPICVSARQPYRGCGEHLRVEVDGCPFYLDAALYRAWHEPRLVLDVAPGPAEEGSLPAAPGMHFVVWSPSRCDLCASPGGTRS